VAWGKTHALQGSTGCQRTKMVLPHLCTTTPLYHYSYHGILIVVATIIAQSHDVSAKSCSSTLLLLRTDKRYEGKTQDELIKSIANHLPCPFWICASCTFYSSLSPFVLLVRLSKG
jgi:hypothetical protein